jgi:penicillin-binding protein A
MNLPIRRVAIAVGVLMAALLLNLNFVQVVKSDSYRNNKNNRRVILIEYSKPRGSISLQDGTVIAESVETKDELKYLRKYPNGATYADLTGWYSLEYGHNAIEETEDGLLSGSDSRLLGTRITDLLTGRTPKGGNVVLTVDKAAQVAAFKGLGGRRGAVVALDPRTGAILAAASSPSYDPSTLSSHNIDAIDSTYKKLSKDPNNPLFPRAFQATYPPGSVMKVIVAAAALRAGHKPNEVIPAPDVYQLPDGGTMRNFNGERCGNGKTTTLIAALTISCNTAFGELGVQVGQQALQDEANLFGMDGQDFSVPLSVSGSTLGQIENGSQLAQSSIGQFNVQMSPMQAAMIAAAVENDGTLMKPYVIDQELAPNLSVLSKTNPKQLNQVLPPDLDGQLKQMMQSVVTNGTGTKAAIQGVPVGGKTGTADNSDAHGKALAPHAWFAGYAADKNHPIAIAVVLENAGVSGNESAGGEAAAPLARDVMKAYLDDMNGR